MLLHFCTNTHMPAVINMANYSPVPSEDLTPEDIISMIEENPDLIISEQAGFCYSPMLCIGKNLEFGEGGPVADLLMMSPYGYVAVVSTKPLRTNCSMSSITKDAENMAKALRKTSSEQLNDISIDYTYARTSKGADIIGAMGDAGYLVYEDEPLLLQMTEKNLKLSRFMYVAVVKDLLDDFTLVNENFSVGFLCVKSYNSSSPFAVASLKVIESD